MDSVFCKTPPDYQILKCVIEVRNIYGIDQNLQSITVNFSLV